MLNSLSSMSYTFVSLENLPFFFFFLSLNKPCFPGVFCCLLVVLLCYYWHTYCRPCFFACLIFFLLKTMHLEKTQSLSLSFQSCYFLGKTFMCCGINHLWGLNVFLGLFWMCVLLAMCMCSLDVPLYMAAYTCLNSLRVLPWFFLWALHILLYSSLL